MRVLLGSAIALGALIGVPIDPEKIRELMALSNRAEQSQIVPKRSDNDEDIEECLTRRGLKVRRWDSLGRPQKGRCDDTWNVPRRLETVSGSAK